MENKDMEITSRENPTFKNLLRLKQKKHRRETGLCIIEGEKQITDLLKSGTSKIEHIVVRKSASAKYEKQFSSANALLILADALFDLITELETDPGVLAAVRIPAPRALTYPFLVLDHIADAGNVGTLLRTAAAFGFGTVVCIECAEAYSPKVLRASMGMQFMLNILTVQSLENINFDALISADLDGSEISAVQTAAKKANGKFGLALGNEGAGLTTEVKRLCTHSVTIPMRAGVESLNVAIAGGILMHALGQ